MLFRSEGVEFKDLGLVVVDEQHRFGVEQRDALRAKGESTPHVLVMTATPIPRTIAMTVFGDLDISTLNQLPSGRPLISTHVVDAKNRPQHLERAWQRVREEVAKGRQVYVVAPRISANDGSDFIKYGLTGQELALARRLSGEGDDEELHGTNESSSVEELFPYLNSGPLKGLRISLLHGRLKSEEKEKVMNSFSRGETDEIGRAHV